MYQNVQKSVKNARAMFLFCLSNPSFFLKFSFPSPSSLLFPQQSRTYKYHGVSTRAEHGIVTVKYQCY